VLAHVCFSAAPAIDPTLALISQESFAGLKLKFTGNLKCESHSAFGFKLGQRLHALGASQLLVFMACSSCW
jgi:hypothetical protein